MAECQWCGDPFRPRCRTSRFCSKRCAGEWQFRDHPRRAHTWGKTAPVDSAHRKMRAQLLPAALGQRCPMGCGRIMTKSAELDHVIARSQGGQTTRGNCRIICAPCNRERGARLGGQQARRSRVMRATSVGQPLAATPRHSRAW